MKKRLLIPATTVPVDSRDGTPSFVLDLAIRLAEYFDVTILAPRVPGAQLVTEVGPVTIRRFSYFPRRWERLASDAIMPRLQAEPWRIVEAVALVVVMTWNTVRYARRSRCDVVNAHWIVPAGLAAWVASKVNHVPYVLTAHGADVYSLRGWLMGRAKSAVLRDAEAVLPVSSDIAAVLSRLGGNRARVLSAVPMGVPGQPPTGIQRTPELLVVGRLVDKKGFDVAVRAVALVADATLRIVGDGPERKRLEKLIESLGVADRVALLGRLGRDEVVAEMRASRCLLIPSRVGSGGDQDGTPVVLAEAMSLGTMVIASDISGLGEYVVDGETGLLVPPDDIGALAAALERIADEPGLVDELGRNARTSFGRSDLDIESTVAAYRRTISEVLV